MWSPDIVKDIAAAEGVQNLSTKKLSMPSLQMHKQEVQLSQRDRAMLRVIEYFAK